MNDRELLMILCIAVVIYTVVIMMHVRKVKDEINKTVDLLGRSLEKEKELSKELTRGMDILIYNFEQLLETRIRKRELLNGTTKIYYNNEYTNTIESVDVPEEIVAMNKQNIATRMVEDILNGRENVL